MADKKIGSLEEEARKRKERLKALREQRNKNDNNDVASKKGKLDLPKPELKLRNYMPIDDNLKNSKLEEAKPGKVENHIKVWICFCQNFLADIFFVNLKKNQVNKLIYL